MWASGTEEGGQVAPEAVGGRDPRPRATLLGCCSQALSSKPGLVQRPDHGPTAPGPRLQPRAGPAGDADVTLGAPLPQAFISLFPALEPLAAFVMPVGLWCGRASS